MTPHVDDVIRVMTSLCVGLSLVVAVFYCFWRISCLCFSLFTFLFPHTGYKFPQKFFFFFQFSFFSSTSLHSFRQSSISDILLSSWLVSGFWLVQSDSTLLIDLLEWFTVKSKLTDDVINIVGFDDVIEIAKYW